MTSTVNGLHLSSGFMQSRRGFPTVASRYLGCRHVLPKLFFDSWPVLGCDCSRLETVARLCETAVPTAYLLATITMTTTGNHHDNILLMMFVLADCTTGQAGAVRGGGRGLCWDSVRI